MDAPVITVDGPAASGKGTIAQQTAAALGFHYLDSGKIYRAAALAALEQKTDIQDSAALAALAGRLAADAGALRRLQDDPALTAPPTGRLASRLAADPALRAALLPLQRAARQPPGLAADGRDMGTVVFPDARVRVFLTADLDVRARRRYKQLQERGICATIESVRDEISQRDRQDSERRTAPLAPANGALLIDSTHQSIGDIARFILRACRDAAVYPAGADEHP